MNQNRDAALLTRVRDVACWLEVRRDRGAIEPDEYRALLMLLFAAREADAVEDFAAARRTLPRYCERRTRAGALPRGEELGA